MNIGERYIFKLPHRNDGYAIGTYLGRIDGEHAYLALSQGGETETVKVPLRLHQHIEEHAAKLGRDSAVPAPHRSGVSLIEEGAAVGMWSFPHVFFPPSDSE